MKHCAACGTLIGIGRTRCDDHVAMNDDATGEMSCVRADCSKERVGLALKVVRLTAERDAAEAGYDKACNRVMEQHVRILELERVCRTMVDHHGADERSILISREDWYAFRKVLSGYEQEKS